MIIPIVYDYTQKDDHIFSHSFCRNMEKTVVEKKHLYLEINGDTYQDFDYDALFGKGPRLIIVRSSLIHWLAPALHFFSQKKIDVLLMGENPCPHIRLRGMIGADIKYEITTLLDHFTDCGCSRTALYNVFEDSVSDFLKRRLFIEQLTKKGVTNPEAACIINHSGLKQCYNDFKSRIHEFDSVLCTNSLAAVSMINHLRRDGVRIPEDIQVSTSGALNIARLFKTPITAIITKSDQNIFKRTIQIYKYLYSNPNSEENLVIKTSGKLEILDTTRPLKSSQTLISTASSVSTPQSNFYNDEEVIAFTKLEQLFSLCDNIDVKLLHYALQGYSYEKISEKLHISTGTVFYRLQRLIQSSQFDSRASLEKFLIAHDFEDMFS